MQELKIEKNPVKNGMGLGGLCVSFLQGRALVWPYPTFAPCDGDCGVEALKSEPAVVSATAENSCIYAAWKRHAISS